VRRQLEIAGVLVAAAAHFVLTMLVGVQGLDIVPIALGCLAYAIWRGRDEPARVAWGFRREGLRACSRDSAWLMIVGTFVCAALGWWRGTLAVDLHLVFPLVLYPVWGLTQQFLVLGLFAHNLDALGLRRPLVLVLTALGFGAVHVPDWPLCAATAVLGSVVACLFFRHRNLWPLGVAHGVLGALFYRWVLGRDVWAELMQMLQ
jgi:hypothetical protein